MRTFASILIAVILVLSGCSRNTDSLAFQVSPGWKLDNQTPSGLHFYILSANTPGEGSFILSPWSAIIKPEEIPTQVQHLADSFSIQAPVSGIVLASHDYLVENFSGAEGRGSYAMFQISRGGTNILQTLFMMSVDNRIWYGQFMGSSNGWPQTLTMLKSVRKIRKQ